MMNKSRKLMAFDLRLVPVVDAFAFTAGTLSVDDDVEIGCGKSEHESDALEL